MDNPAYALGAVATAAALAPKTSPEPARPLELMTELAVRQVIHLSKFVIKDIPLPQQERAPSSIFSLTHPSLEKAKAGLPPAGEPMPQESNILDRIVGAHQ